MPVTPGATLGPYTLRAELGHGGMDVVYTGHDPRLDRQVAIKILPPDLTHDDTAKQRFPQEAKSPPPSTTPTSAPFTKSMRHRMASAPHRADRPVGRETVRARVGSG